MRDKYLARLLVGTRTSEAATGHLTVKCRVLGCASKWYRPWHYKATAGLAVARTESGSAWSAQAEQPSRVGDCHCLDLGFRERISKGGHRPGQRHVEGQIGAEHNVI